ncbi:MAG TPA: glycosyltransferase family 39 protein [Jatrophihabitans sp.]
MTPTATYPSALVRDHSRECRPVARTGRENGALAGLLGLTALLYLWGLGASGYANDFYAAAVQAGTKSWTAFFFGSLDSANAITVDKPPAALWPMELSGRLFGFSSWSMLVPEALMGVAAVWVLYATVRRWFGPTAGLLAGALLAITPVAVLMFRFNNPDALMTLLIVVAAYCVTRALENASTKWLLPAGAALGFSFLAKGLQPFTVVPALAAAYLVAAPAPMRRRLLQLVAAGVAIVVAAGWWVLAVDLTPAADRPYIGGSGNNTALGLAFGYNGLSRIAGGSGVGGFSGSSGVDRLFNSIVGGQISWLLPAALLACGAIGIAAGRAGRTDRTRAALILWGGWLLVTGTVLSFATGIIHAYYTIELAPAIAALVAIGAVVMWRRRAEPAVRVVLGAGILVTGLWSMTLLQRGSDWSPGIAVLVAIAGVLGAVAVLVPAGRALGVAGIAAGLVAAGGGSLAYAVDTAATAHAGSTPAAGPPVASSGFGGRPQAVTRGGMPGQLPSQMPGGMPGGTPPAGFRPPSGSRPSGSMPAGGPGGGGRQATVSSALVRLLSNAGTTWSAATIGARSAAPLELQSGTAVIAVGGFSGSDESPTLAHFQALVKAGKVRYFISSATGGPGGAGGSSSGAISAWVQGRFTARTVGGTTVYDLTKAK